METKDKEAIKHRYAAALYKALKASHFNSYRSLALHCGIEPTHMQKISTGKVDVSTTTNVAIANGLGITYTDYSAYFDMLSEVDIKEFESFIATKLNRRGKKTKS